MMSDRSTNKHVYDTEPRLLSTAQLKHHLIDVSDDIDIDVDFI